MSQMSDQLLDALLRDIMAERAAAVERAAIDEDAMTGRLLGRLAPAGPAILGRQSLLTAVRLAIIVGLLAALLAMLGILGQHRRVLGNGIVSWVSNGRVVAVTGFGATPSVVGAAPTVGANTGCCALAWSPDGTHLAAVSDTELDVLDASGHRSTPAPDLSVRGTPSWSPDGTRLAVAGIDHNATHIFVVDVTGHDAPRRIDGDVAVSAGPAWSPDGRSIAFGATRTENAPAKQGQPTGDRWGLYLAAADGSSEPRLISGDLPAPWNNLPQVLMAQAPSWDTTWSPDGRSLAFMARSTECCGYRIYIVGADGQGQRAISPASLIATNPVWSPDGRRLAYASWGSRLSPPIDLVVATVDGGSSGVAPSVTVAHDIDPWDIVWSPDGTWLAYGHGESGQLATAAQSFADLWIVHPDGSSRLRLAIGPFEAGIAWQPLAR